MCDKNCRFTKRTVNGKAIKMIPEKLSECCSLGVFALPVTDNLNEKLPESKRVELLNRLTADLRNYTGDENLLQIKSALGLK